MEWIQTYVKKKGCETIELNTYIENSLSQDFYSRQGFKKLGFHYLKSI